MDVYFTLEFPSQLNLTLKPMTEGFSILPNLVRIKVGDVKIPFRVSVPNTFTEGTYQILWTTIGDLVPPVYTPVKNSTVVITRNTSIPIIIDPINRIPFGGWSLPIYVYVTQPPDIGISITLNFKSSYQGMELSKSKLDFRAGKFVDNFSISTWNNITSDNFVSKGSIVFILEGVNAPMYALSSSIVDFYITAEQTDQPIMYNYEVTGLGKTWLNVTVNVSKICQAYYLLALAGSRVPTFDELLKGEPPRPSSEKAMFGSFTVKSTLMASLYVSSLVAQTPYELFIGYLDRSYNPSQVYKIPITTKDRFYAADFSLRFLQSTLTPVERKHARDSVAFVLGLQEYQVVEQKYVIQAPKSRVLQSSQTSTIINLQIVENPGSEVYPQPRVIALMLNQRKYQLTARMPTLDPSFVISASDFPAYRPSFPNVPYITGFDFSSITLAGQLDNYGWLYAVAIKANETYSMPTSYQIANALNASNVPAPWACVEVTQAYQIFTLNISGLSDGTKYNIFVVGGSAHPGYPDLMDSKRIVTLNVTTLKDETVLFLDLDLATRLEFTLGVMLSLLAFMISFA
eukprot:TRINITY_DN10026_c0_g1_i2.p1 TRINITY_DN10026_c0_g1~~TRINITY_DN10026_c0_g1_i2.p1  ORF type:complete len:572 (+),score=94.11 TRINITY_DN10026_c0_g1_i2:553-2268(+)